MKINSISNKQSFKALMLENKPTTENQEKMIMSIIEAGRRQKRTINFLENNNSDVYITPNSDGKTIDLSLRTSAGLFYNFIPSDESGAVKTNIHVPYQHFENTPKAEKRLHGNMQIRTMNFLKRCKNCITNCMNNEDNITSSRRLDVIALSDFAKKRISRPESVPDADAVLGNPAVETQESLYC